MRKTRGKGIILLVLSVFFLSGCAGMDLLLMAGDAALIGFDVNQSMKSVDWQGTNQASFKKVWKAALLATQEMGITITDKKLNEKKDGGVITGKTGTHQKIQVVIATVTPSITRIGISNSGRLFRCFWGS